MEMKTLVTFGVLCAVQMQAQVKQPNIVIFIADDAGMDFGCYGNKNIKTPNIDRLAKGGLRFEKAYLTAPQSSPSRTSMMTGQFAHTIGTEDLHVPLNAGIKMLPHYLRQAGYFTGSMFKTHWGPHGNAQFDRMIKSSSKDYKQFITDSGDAPFFIWCGFTDPHRNYDRETCPQVNDPETVIVPPYLVDAPQTRRDLADYYDEISRMDKDIGNMIAFLEEKNILENTVIVFLTDNGMPFPRAKGTLYDSGIQTPLLFMWKNHIKPNQAHNNGLVSTIDLAATLMDLAGTSMGDSVYSRSFKHLLFDPSKRGRDYIFAERNWHAIDDYIRCVRTEKFKLIYNAYTDMAHGMPRDLATSLSANDLMTSLNNETLTGAQKQIFVVPRASFELYDLEKDPHELRNLANTKDSARIGKHILEDYLLQWQKETDDHPSWDRLRKDRDERFTGLLLPSH